MNTKPLCKALRAPATHLGETEPGPCSQRATHGEYCHAHDPRRVEERAIRTRERVMGLARQLDVSDLRALATAKDVDRGADDERRARRFLERFGFGAMGTATENDVEALAVMLADARAGR